MNAPTPSHHKVRAEHLKRDAYLYVRQSSMRQVLENTESTKRQYQLRERALALGWISEQIRVIDCDQGLSGASDTRRDGFQQLVSEVSLGNAGLVMGLEVSRLARNNADWHRLLQLCAFAALSTGYDPFDDDEEALLAFADGHPVLKMLCKRADPWPGLGFGETPFVDAEGWHSVGPLRAMEYRVGYKGLAQQDRRSILKKCVESRLRFPSTYTEHEKQRWGVSRSQTRLKAIALS